MTAKPHKTDYIYAFLLYKDKIFPIIFKKKYFRYKDKNTYFTDIITFFYSLSQKKTLILWYNSYYVMT